MTTMGSTDRQVDLNTEIGLLEVQLSTNLNDLRKIDPTSAQATVISDIESKLAKSKTFLDEQKKVQLQAKKVFDSDILGSDAESEDGHDVLKALELEEAHRRKKLLARKEKKIAEAIKSTCKTKKELLVTLISNANKLLVVMETAVGEVDGKDRTTNIVTYAEYIDHAQKTEDVQQAPQLPVSAQGLVEAVVEIDTHKNNFKNVERQLSDLKLSIKIAFDADEATATTGLENTSSSGQTDIAVAKLKEFNVSQQLISILDSLNAPQAARTFALHEFAKLQTHLAEKIAENKTLVDQTAELATIKTALARAQKEAANFKIIATRLKQDLKEKEPLLRVAIDLRRGAIEAAKRTWIGGDMRIVHGDPKREIIEAKNAAVHRGQFLADRSLYTLGHVNTKELIEDMVYLYGYWGSNRSMLSCPKIIELFDLRGSMVMCYFRTKYTHDKDADDDFEKVYDECLNLWLEFSKETTGEEARKKFGSSAQVELKLAHLRRIVANTAKKERDVFIIVKWSSRCQNHLRQALCTRAGLWLHNVTLLDFGHSMIAFQLASLGLALGTID
ncbi:hypothetical protein BDZ45DRAFT_763970 [Acephala macrosclerotiorum]|nr:hypothetical protein BDZ45DRAFT_763970 [Acephala macrosclerotiorum]